MSGNHSQTSEKIAKLKRGTFKRLFVIPFGRYRRHPPSASIDESVFIGRDGSKAYLIDALTSNARRGAYLITGRRGVGKSTFVDLCVREAEELKFRRYMRRSAGRTPVDWLIIAAFFFLLLLFIAADSEILGARKQIQSVSARFIFSSVLWIPPLLIVLYAFSCIRAAIVSIGFFNWMKSMATAVTILGFAIGYNYFYSPIVALTSIVVGLLVLACFGNLIGLLASTKKLIVLSTLRSRIIYTTFVLIFSLGLSNLLLAFVSQDYTCQHSDCDSLVIRLVLALHPVFISFVIIGLICIQSSVFKFARFEKNSNGVLFSVAAATAISSFKLIAIAFFSFFVNAVIFYTLSQIQVGSISFYAITENRVIISILALTVTLLGLVLSVYSVSTKLMVDYKIARPVESLLILKAFGLIAIAIHIIDPYFYKDSASLRVDMLVAESIWIFLTFVVITIIFAIEFSWITRSLARFRFPHFLSSAQGEGSSQTHHNDHVWTTQPWVENEKGEPTKYGANCEAALTPDESVKMFRNLNGATFSSALVRFWTPSIVVRINLGFDSLDHRSVIHAMLHGLHDEYEKRFFKGLGAYRILGIATRCVVVLLLVSAISRALFDYPLLSFSPSDALGTDVSNEVIPSNRSFDFVDGLGQTQPCQSLLVVHKFDIEISNPEETGFIYRLCRAYPSNMNRVLPLLYAPILSIPFSQNENSDNSGPAGIMDRLLHKHADLPEYIGQFEDFEQNISHSFRIFHALLFLVVYWLATPFISYFSPFPYRRNLRKIETLADSLIQSASVMKKRGRWSPIRFLASLTRSEKEEEFARAPLDSRSVELTFMALLSKIAEPRLIMEPRILMAHAPAPDIIFIFDELDKLGGKPSPEEDRHQLLRNTNMDERLRSEALHDMLSDMKQLISSAPARFIFVGNRVLHDEYMADEGKREPLLSTIFDADLYLPSLLLDSSQIDSIYEKDENEKHTIMERRIREYVQHSYRLATYYNEQQKNSWSSFAHLIAGARSASVAFKPYTPKLKEVLRVTEWGVIAQSEMLRREMKSEMSSKKIDQMSSIHSEICFRFLQEFYGFVAFRSKGIPKKLGDIIAGYIRPTQRLLLNEKSSLRVQELERTLEGAEDALLFDHSNIYRVQFINTLFRQLTSSFQTQLLERDDKVTIDVLYLFDFILKFHGRAFSWSNLEHVDELAHIHKTPDLRRTISDVLDAGIGRFLHPVLNGLYSFRFRSEFAAEVRHLSKLNETEMAAFNFTLDESQQLKSAYTHMIRNSEQPNEDMMVAIGELHEYDQEYEKARGWYYSALFLNDREFGQYVGESVDVQDSLRERLENDKYEIGSLPSIGSLEQAAGIATPPERVPYIRAILTGDPIARESVTVHLPWATRRIRLLLQIGLTYEQTNDFERARSYYFSAHKLASALTDQIHHRATEVNETAAANSAWFAMACDHLEVLYQPAFAAAWVAEKSAGSIDGATDIVEFELHILHARLSPRITKSQKSYPGLEGVPQELKDKLFRNYAMIGAEAHNKAGDLYFFKGHMDLSSEAADDCQFLSTATRHYSCALSLIASYIQSRGAQQGSLTSRSVGAPSFISQIIYSNLSDIAETTFATLSISKIVTELNTTENLTEKSMQTPVYKLVGEVDLLANVDFNSLLLQADKVLNSTLLNRQSTEDETRDSQISNQLLTEINFDLAIALDDIFLNRRNEFSRVEQSLLTGDICTLVRALVFSALGASVAEQSGMKRTAIDEYVMTVEMIERVFKWLRISRHKKLCGAPENSNLNTNYYSLILFLSNAAYFCLSKVGHLYNGSRVASVDTVNSKPIGTPDERVLADAASQACGILLSLSALTTGGVYLRRDLEEKNSDKSARLSGSNQSERRMYKSQEKIRDLVRSWFDIDNGWVENPNSASKSVGKLQLDDYDFESNVSYPVPNVRQWAGSPITMYMCPFRKFARSRLIFLNDRYCFPFLASLQRLKFLADDVYLSDSPKYTEISVLTRRRLEADRWLDDLIKGAERFDNTALHTNLDLAESTYLKERSIIGESRGKESNLSAGYASLALQTITMGNEYYRLIRNMLYLFDDFNDRKVHFRHAIQMAGKDVLKLIAEDYGE